MIIIQHFYLNKMYLIKQINALKKAKLLSSILASISSGNNSSTHDIKATTH
jgi:hypothetical protein